MKMKYNVNVDVLKISYLISMKRLLVLVILHKLLGLAGSWIVYLMAMPSTLLLSLNIREVRLSTNFLRRFSFTFGQAHSSMLFLRDPENVNFLLTKIVSLHTETDSLVTLGNYSSFLRVMFLFQNHQT